MSKKTRALIIGALSAGSIIATTTSAFATDTQYLGNNCGISESYWVMRAADCPDSLLLTYHQAGIPSASAEVVGSIPNLSQDPVYSNGGSTVDYYIDFEFWPETGGDTDGEFQAVRNNAAWAYNISATRNYTVYVSPNYTGHSQYFGPRSSANLNAYLRNNEASVLQW